MIIHKEKFNAATISGEWSANTEAIPGAICQQVYIKSDTATTTFDLAITEEKDIEIRGYTDIVGCVNDLTPFLARGVHTVSISNATADEDFEVLLCFLEK